MSVIRVRCINGDVHTVRDGSFVEVCDDDGLIACLVYKTHAGVVRIVFPDSVKETEHYAKTFDVKFCKNVLDVPSEINDQRSLPRK